MILYMLCILFPILASQTVLAKSGALVPNKEETLAKFLAPPMM